MSNYRESEHFPAIREAFGAVRDMAALNGDRYEPADTLRTKTSLERSKGLLEASDDTDVTHSFIDNTQHYEGEVIVDDVDALREAMDVWAGWVGMDRVPGLLEQHKKQCEQDVSHELEHVAAARSLGLHAVKFGLQLLQAGVDRVSFRPFVLPHQPTRPITKLGNAFVIAAPNELSDGDLQSLRNLGYTDKPDVMSRLSAKSFQIDT